MRRVLVFIISALLSSCYAANGQNLLERLGQRAKNAVENKLGEKVEQGVNDVLDGKIGKKKKKDKADKQTADPFSQDAVAMPDAKVPAQPKKQVETSYAKTDFVPGDEIFFEDTFENEQLGEFPSRWDLVSGYAKVGSIEGRKIIAFTDDGSGAVMPLMKEPRTFLPDVFTLEYDVFLGVPGDYEDERESGSNTLSLVFGNSASADDECGTIVFWYRGDGSSTIHWNILKPDAATFLKGEKQMGLNDGLSDYNGKDNPLKPGRGIILPSPSTRGPSRAISTAIASSTSRWHWLPSVFGSATRETISTAASVTFVWPKGPYRSMTAWPAKARLLPTPSLSRPARPTSSPNPWWKLSASPN